jgi:hypothetical protein
MEPELPEKTFIGLCAKMIGKLGPPGTRAANLERPNLIAILLF